MSRAGHELGIPESERFNDARRCLLPNENVQSVCEVKGGFLVLSDRRILILEDSKQTGFRIGHVIPYECLVRFEQTKSDRVVLLGAALDQYGRHIKDTKAVAITAPRIERGADMTGVRRQFQDSMSNCLRIADEIKTAQSTKDEPPPARSYRYLSDLPTSLTQNALLDLNTILEDWPVHSEMHQKTLKYLGDRPFLLEESLRDGSDKESGILFAAGQEGYFWIRGRKQGRFMTDVSIDTVDWSNIRCFVHRWQNDKGTIDATYSMHRDGKESTVHYLWSPPINEDTLGCPWLIQPLNGPWILADVKRKYTGQPMPASWDRGTPSVGASSYRQRFYL